MLYPRLLSLAVAAFVFSLASHQANAQVLLNGGFENPRITPGTVSTAVPTAWTDLSDRIISNGTGSFGNTPYGTQYVILTPGDALTQTISGFTANQTYVLGFDYELQTGSDASALTVSVSGAANTGSPFALSGGGFGGNDNLPFQSGVMIFTASSSGSATISFSDVGAAIALDNVGLYGNIVTPPDAPEPSTYAEMLLGMLALGAFGLMRRQSAQA